MNEVGYPQGSGNVAVQNTECDWEGAYIQRCRTTPGFEDCRHNDDMAVNCDRMYTPSLVYNYTVKYYYRIENVFLIFL